MKIPRSLSVLTIFILTQLSTAQVNQEWVARYDGGFGVGDHADAIAVDTLGNVFVTGWSGGIEGYDYATIKYNSSGIQQWVQRYNGPGNGDDVANSLVIDGNGNVYVTGRSVGDGSSSDFATIKYNSTGVEQWVQRYNGTENDYDEAVSIAVDITGNVYVTGYSVNGLNTFEYITIKYNPSGVQQWLSIYNYPGNNINKAVAIAVDDIGNSYVTGKSVNGTFVDIATIKYNSSGVQQWVQRFHGPGNQNCWPSALVLDPTGNVFITGDNSNDMFTTIKYSSSGVQQWVSFMQGGYQPSSLAVDNFGNVYVSGTNTLQQYATVKYNSSGVQQWIVTHTGVYGGAGANGMKTDNVGNIYVTGGSDDFESSPDYVTIKYNPSGVQQWLMMYHSQYSGVVGNSAFAIAVDKSNNVYVTGESKGSGSNFNMDYATVKYSQPTGIIISNNNIPDKFSLYQNYPNPFNPSTKISYDLPKEGLVKLVVFDALGREIKTLVNERQDAGSYKVEFDGSSIPSGVYFYKLHTSEFTQTKKMVLIK